MRYQRQEGRGTFTLRVGDGERRVLEAAAAQTGEPLGHFIRRASLAVAREELAAPPEQRGGEA